MRLSRLLILVGAVSAWLVGSLPALCTPVSVADGDARHAPGSPQPVWAGIGEGVFVAAEQRSGTSGDDEPQGYVWLLESGNRSVGGPAVVGGRSVGASSYLRHVLGARGPPA